MQDTKHTSKKEGDCIPDQKKLGTAADASDTRAVHDTQNTQYRSEYLKKQSQNSLLTVENITICIYDDTDIKTRHNVIFIIPYG